MAISETKKGRKMIVVWYCVVCHCLMTASGHPCSIFCAHFVDSIRICKCAECFCSRFFHMPVSQAWTGKVVSATNGSTVEW